MKIRSALIVPQQREPIVQVQLNGPVTEITMNFEMRDGIYRAQQEDVIHFFAYQGPGRGYGGRSFDIVMQDGTPRTLKGPWSSRASVINAVFPDRAPAIDATDRHLNIGMHVDITKLEALGLKFAKDLRANGEITFIPQL